MSRPKPPLPTLVQFLVAPRMMRRMGLWMGDHGLTFEEARRWHVAWTMLRHHLSTTYGRRWRRTAPAELRVQANPVYFDPRKLPEGTPGRNVPEVLARMAADKDQTR
jgi:hypothetical protein